MKQRLFAALAQAVYGYGWQSKLARELGVHRSTVHRWASGVHAIPPWARERFPKILSKVDVYLRG